MATIIVGGHARNVGKTSFVAALIKSFHCYPWTAVKISSHWHQEEKTGNAADGSPCFVFEETDSAGHSDSSRYLAAGARRSLWVRVREDRWAGAVEVLSPLLCSEPFLIVEGNNALRFLTPDLYVLVMDYGVEDFKESALDNLGRVDAAIAMKYRPGRIWASVPPEPLEHLTLFHTDHPGKIPRQFIDFARTKLNI